MTLLSPVWLFLLLLIPLVVLLHLFRRHRRSEVVPSLLIWKLVSKRVPRTLDLRVLRDLNLLLQILAVIAAAILLSRPVMSQAARTSARNVVLVVDVSAGMAAEEEGASRFSSAVADAVDIAGGSTGRVAVVAASARPRLVQNLTSNTEDVAGALRSLRLEPVAGAPDAALELAAGIAGESGEVHFFTDGAFDGQALDRAAQAVVHQVGSATPNVGITRLAARQAPTGWEILVVTENFSDDSVSVDLQIGREGEIADVRSLEIEPRVPDYQLIQIDSRMVDSEVAIFAELTGLPAEVNGLAADDRADLVLDPSPSARVLLVSEQSYFLETMLSVLPGVELQRAETYPAPGRHDAVIFDGVTPPPLLSGNYLVFGVRPPDLPTSFGEPVAVSDPISWDTNHPLFRSADLSSVEIYSARPVGATAGISTIARAGTLPVAFTYERGELRIVGFTFSLTDSDFPLRVAFPIVLQNAIEWLLPAANLGNTRQVATGQVYTVSVPVGDPVAIMTPSGETTRGVVEANPFVINDTSEAGIYLIEAPGFRRRFATALMSSDESNLTPRFSGGTRPAAEEAADSGAGRPVWRFVLALLSICIAADWLVWVRRS